MPIAYIRPINPAGPLLLVEIIALSPGSPPERPHPGPTPPGPVDPGYSPPWAQVPEPGVPPSPGPGVNAIVIPAPPPAEGQPAPTPPAGMPPDSKQVLIWYGPGTLPAMAWVAPYASTGPIAPPA